MQKFIVFMNFAQMCDASFYLVVVQCPSCSWYYIEDWVLVLQRFLAIPARCASGLQAWPCQHASSLSGHHQPAQQTLNLYIRCAALCKPSVTFSVHRQILSGRISIFHCGPPVNLRDIKITLILNSKTHYIIHFNIMETSIFLKQFLFCVLYTF